MIKNININIEQETKNCINWIKNWFDNESGSAKGVVIAVSGGKDSTVVAKLCVEAIGSDRVFGLLMPNGAQSDINDSLRVCELTGISYDILNIKEIYDAFLNVSNKSNNFENTKESLINVPPKIRMTMLYLVSQSINMSYRVVGTGNLSERYIGYCTKWGDMSCDFNPVANFTSDEVIAVGDYMGLPYELVHKTPSDGLSGQTDEDRIGFSYQVLNKYIRTGICEDSEIKAKIDKMHGYAMHKINPIPVYFPQSKK